MAEKQTKNWQSKVEQLMPGLVLVFSLSTIITLLVGDGIGVISPIVIALVLGISLGNVLKINEKYGFGINFTVKTLLKVAIILLGLRFNFQQILGLGLSGIVLILICMLGAALATFVVARLLDLPPRLATLIGIGTAICGNSAIMAAAPVINASDEEIAVAVSTITVFGTIAVILYPIIGRLLNFTDGTFGLWSGTAINDTSQVIAAAFSFSLRAGEIATLVKITRNILMGPTIVLIGFSFARRNLKTAQFSLAKAFPGFILGFLGLATINSFGIVPPLIQGWSQTISVFLVQTVLIGVGLNTNLRKMGKMGAKGFVAGLVAALFISIFSIISIYLGQKWLFEII